MCKFEIFCRKSQTFGKIKRKISKKKIEEKRQKDEFKIIPNSTEVLLTRNGLDS